MAWRLLASPGRLRMNGLRRRRIPTIVFAIHIHDRGGSQFGRCCLIEAADTNAIEGPEPGRLAVAKYTHAAVPAKAVGFAPGAELIGRQGISPRRQAPCIGRHKRSPAADFLAVRAVTAQRTGRQIDVRFKAHCAAMATAVIAVHMSSVSPRAPASIITDLALAILH